MSTILARPVSPRNPQLSPLQVRSLLCQLRRIIQRIHRPRTSLVCFALTRLPSALCFSFLFSFPFFAISLFIHYFRLSFRVLYFGSLVALDYV